MPSMLQPSNVVLWIQIDPVKFEWLSKINTYWIDLKILTTQNKRGSTNFTKSFIKFWLWMLKLQHLELLCEDTFGPIGHLGVKLQSIVGDLPKWHLKKLQEDQIQTEYFQNTCPNFSMSYCWTFFNKYLFVI